MARTKAMYPAPVYHATLDDGRTVRMTVWQDQNAPQKGFDWEICRRTIMGLTDRIDEPRILTWARSRRKIFLASMKAAKQYRKETSNKVYVKCGIIGDFTAERGKWAWSAPTLAMSGRKIISAHLEQSGEVLADDPLCEANPVKKRVNNSQIMAALRAFLEGKPEARQLAEMALAA